MDYRSQFRRTALKPRIFYSVPTAATNGLLLKPTPRSNRKQTLSTAITEDNRVGTTSDTSGETSNETDSNAASIEFKFVIAVSTAMVRLEIVSEGF